MRICFKTYEKRNGDLMLYINRSNKVSVGVTEDGFFPYGKHSSNGKRNAYHAALNMFDKHGLTFTGDLTKHAENGFSAPVTCGPFTIVGTDVANVGGMSVGSDGGYVVCDGKILRQNQWLTE